MATAFPSIAALNLDAIAGGTAATNRGAARTERLRAQAQDFEVQFVNSMFQHMYTGLEGDGPFGNSSGVGPWRSFLTEEYAKSFVKSGGLGIANSVYSSLLALQEARPK
jgi:flagellar protein FlgJ